MRGFGAFLAKEFAEIGATWRIWVLPLILLFFGVSSPILARAMPELLPALAPGTGIKIELPPPTALDAHAQYLKNLSQVTTLAIVFATAGALSAELAAGTAILVLTKPVSRRAFVLAKAVSNSVLVAAATLGGAVACLAVIALLFEEQRPGAFLAGVGLWLAFGLVLTAAMLLASALFDSHAGASGIGLFFFFLAMLGSLWPPARDWTYAGLLASAADAMAGKPVEPAWQLGSAGLAWVVLVGLATWAFERREL